MTTDVREPLDPPEPAEPFDDALRWIIPSRTNPHESYVVELDSYAGNGECQCKWFETQFRPLLSRRVTPADAVQAGMVRLKKGEAVEDALRCWHIKEAQKRFACAMVGALAAARKAHEKVLRKSYAQPQNSPPSRRSA